MDAPTTSSLHEVGMFAPRRSASSGRIVAQWFAEDRAALNERRRDKDVECGAEPEQVDPKGWVP